jgi:hypothetical protein
MAYIYDLADTWADGATTFTAIKMNVTDSASAAASNLMDLQVGGVSRFSVNKIGQITVPGGTGYTTFSLAMGSARFSAIGTNLYAHTGASFSLARFKLDATDLSLGLHGASYFGFAAADPATSLPDVRLFRDAANTLGQRNGVNAQTFNLYNTYTDASNYERGFMKWNSNVLEIGAEAAGTGTARDIRLTRRAFFSQNAEFEGVVYNKRIGVICVWGQFGGDNNYIGTESSHNFSFRTANVNRLTFDTIGSMRLQTALTVATLPGTPTVGMMARVTDADAPAVGSTVVGGGAAAALCWYNGTNWTVIGV